jgi:CDP-glycerol glycerophosphotransferase
VSAWAKAMLALRQLLTPRTGRDVLFASFGGRYSDNPRAIFEGLCVRSPRERGTWVADPDAPFPPDLLRVHPATADYAAAAGRASLVVSNARITHYVKKHGVVYVQTWHGTPLKRIGFDNPGYVNDRDGLRRAASDYARWDILLSQNPYSTAIFRQAFRYDGEILECGYPRNDVLLSAQATAVREQTRQLLGLRPDQLVVLYAPTHRDDVTASGVPAPLALDLDRLRAAFGARVHWLLRLHHRDITRLGGAGNGWTDVSNHPDIAELYLAADVLVTDYSSAMFDFAITGKPILFFVHDLEHYRDSVRGFYFDLEADAPGPLCRTLDELIGRLDETPAAEAAFAPAYQAFREKFCCRDDGHATDRVLDRLLS